MAKKGDALASVAPRGGCWLLLATLLTAPAAADEATPQRGMPEILRGSVAAPASRIEPAAGPETVQLTAGERLWIVDERTGRLTACRLLDTSQVGGQVIRCTESQTPLRPQRRD